jgi:hypothetical protein
VNRLDPNIVLDAAVRSLARRAHAFAVAERNHKMAVSAHAYVMPRGQVQIAEFVFTGGPGDVRSVARFFPTGSSVKR